jgi:hypothetical protein
LFGVFVEFVVVGVRVVSHEDGVLLLLGQLVVVAGVAAEVFVVAGLALLPQLVLADAGVPTCVVFAQGVVEAAGVTVAGFEVLFVVEVEVMVLLAPLAAGRGVLQGDWA